VRLSVTDGRGSVALGWFEEEIKGQRVENPPAKVENRLKRVQCSLSAMSRVRSFSCHVGRDRQRWISWQHRAQDLRRIGLSNFWLAAQIQSNQLLGWFSRWVGCLKGVFKSHEKKRLITGSTAATPLLGSARVCVIGHGRSNAQRREKRNSRGKRASPRAGMNDENRNRSLSLRPAVVAGRGEEGLVMAPK